MQLAVEYNFRL